MMMMMIFMDKHADANMQKKQTIINKHTIDSLFNCNGNVNDI